MPQMHSGSNTLEIYFLSIKHTKERVLDRPVTFFHVVIQGLGTFHLRALPFPRVSLSPISRWQKRKGWCTCSEEVHIAAAHILFVGTSHMTTSIARHLGSVVSVLP